MVFPQRGEENLLRRTTSCKNFQPNMFNKVKCQNCFRTREAHDLDSDAANKKPKKVILCGYLFVAPGLDPENPASRSRKWQRRFFVIYETGELCYQLDDNPSTAPQGTVNMYTCTEVFNAKNSIGHDHSMGVVTPDGTLFIKAETHEEKNSWFVVLSEYPKMNAEAEKYKRRKKKKEERESSIPVRIDTSNQGVSTSPSDSKPTSSSLGRMSSFKENIQPPEGTSPDQSSESRPSSGGTRASHLRHSDHLNFRRSRSLRENVRKPRELLDEEEDSLSHSDTASGEEREKTSTTAPPVSRTRAQERLPRRHTSPIKRVDYPTPNVAKLRQSAMRPMEDSTDDDEIDDDELKVIEEKDSEAKEGKKESPHRNNNNVYESSAPEESSISYIPTRKNSSGGDGGSGRSSRKSSITDRTQTANLKHSEQQQQSESAVLTDEELANLDVTRRGRLRLAKLHGDGENQSPSKRTIDKRRHAKERRNRHTMDGSLINIELIPVLDNDKKFVKNERQKLKRSNSDPSLADTEDAIQRKEIAEIFPELYHLKSGWLNLMGEAEDDWSKHWFVLKENKLSYYKDSKDDMNVQGSYDLADSVEAVDFTIGRNYGFKIKMKTQDDLVLSAMTGVIRTKWVSALNKAIQTAKSDSRKSSVDEGSITPRIENVSESIPVKKDEDDITQVDSNKMATEEELKMRAPSQRIRDRKSRRLSASRKDELKQEPRLSSEGDVFFDAVQSHERKQPEGRSESPIPDPITIAQPESGEIGDAWEDVVDALKARLKVVDDENAALKVQTFQLQEQLTEMKYPRENSAEVERLDQIEKLVKVRSKLEHDMDELKMQLKQMRNASDLTEQKNQELKEQVSSGQEELKQKNASYENLQARFERLVADLKEMETERSTARTKRKEERDKAVDVIERLNQRIDDLEQESIDAKGEVRQKLLESDQLRKKCQDLERRLADAIQKEDLVIVECEGNVEAAAAAPLRESGDHSASGGDRRVQELEGQLEDSVRETKSLLAQLQGANQSIQILKRKLQAKDELDSNEGVSQRLEELRVEIGEKEEEIEGLRSQLELAEGGQAGAESRRERLAQEMARGQQRVTEAEELLAQEQESKLRAKEELKSTEAERDSLAERLTARESELKKLSESNSRREKESGRQGREIEELMDALRAAREQKGRLEQERDVSRQEAEGLRKEVESKEDLLGMVQGEMTRIKGEWTNNRRELERLKLENEDLSGKLDSARSESESWRGRAETLENISRQSEGDVVAPPIVEQLRDELVKERSSSDAALKNLEIEMVSKQEELQVVSSQAEDYQKQLQLLTDALKHKAETVIKLQAELAKRDKESTGEQSALIAAKSLERLEKEIKRLCGEVERSQAEFDALDIRHRQLTDESDRAKTSHGEEVKLMGQRIQDLTAKLGAAEKKVLAATSKEAKGSKHKACKAREAEAASKVEGLEAQLQLMEKKLKLATHKLLEMTSREVELRKAYQAKCIEGSRYKEQSCSTQRELILLRKKVSNVDEVLREHETEHQQSLSDVKESYAIKMRSMEEERRKEQEKDAEALTTALEAVKRVYSDQLQQELQVMQAGSTKDVDAMLRRHKDVVTHMNKDWVIMSSKFSGLCRENARLSSVINGLRDTLHGVQRSVKESSEANQTRLDDLAANVAAMKASTSDGSAHREEERLRPLNMSLRLREFELESAREELKTLRTIGEAKLEARSTEQEDEPEGAVGGSDHYLNAGLKVSSL